jgi:hypothetical protein
MFDTLKMLMSEVDGLKEADYLEPHLEPGEGDVIVGIMPDHLRAMYTICRKMEKGRDTYAIEMKYMTVDRKNACMMHFSEVDQSFYLLYSILIFETRSHFRLWDKHQIFFFTGYRVGYQNPSDFNTFAEKLNIKILG